MTTDLQNTSDLESGEPMEPLDTAAKQVNKLANSTSDVVMKYVFMAILILFGTLFYFQWRQNSASPDRVISLMETQITTLTASLKVQETSLEKIRDFAIQVPMEHREMANKQAMTDERACRIENNQSALQDAIKANSDAVKENTAAVARLIGVIEQRLAQDSLPNASMPPN